MKIRLKIKEFIKTTRHPDGKQKFKSQEDLATALGVERQTICAWNTGEKHPSLVTVIRLAALFGCTVDELKEEKEGHNDDGQ